MIEIRYSPKALQDLEEIDDYISETLQSPIAASNVVTKILDKIDKLVDFPQMGALLSAIHDDVDTNNYRFIVCANYMIFYRVEDPHVYIDRIIYGRRDYIAIIFNDNNTDLTD